MRTITCITPKNFNISKDKTYEILDEDAKRYYIRNDKDLVSSYSKNLFVLNEEEVIPEIKGLTLEDILNNISIGTDGTFIATYKDHGITFKKSLPAYVYNTTNDTSSISCGVKVKGSINAIYANYLRLLEDSDFKKLISSINSLSDDDYNIEYEIFIKILTSLFNHILDNNQLEKEMIKGRQLIISLKHLDFSPYVIEKLLNLYPIHSTILNSNSGNTITTFIIDRRTDRPLKVSS